MSVYTKNQLQESTKVILDNLSEEYRTLLIQTALNHNNLSNTEDILPKDLVITNEEFKRSLLDKKNNKRERFIKLLRFVGLLYMFIGLSIYIFMNIQIENSIQMISIVISGIGIFIAISSYFLELNKDLISIRKKRTAESIMDNGFQIVRKWNEIEELSYKIIRKEENISTNIPITKLFNTLFNKRILDNQDREDFKYVLELRNTLVHHTNKEASQEQIIKGLNKADSIIAKLKGSYKS
ncbi:hypothetical protein [Rossellomorea vietnamensis]|uniref:hypothetical protein n=1 Tax=Rossellomorea vietnamensis TaxID=218284 RepID=UPI001E4BF055|nr:hypothetical protein [Rossellomorea vietnamensis]MCC5801847.1 hypothetical protein [Rossellomorea vietnamensis]